MFVVFSVSYRGCFVNESARMEPRSFQRWDFKGRFCMILCGRFFFGCFFPPGFLKVALEKGGLEKMA